MKEQFKIKPAGFEVNRNIIKEKSHMISKIWFILFFAGTTIISLGLAVVFWGTSAFENAIISQLELKNGTQTFEWWERPPVHPVLKVRIFNYTNVEACKAGNASKLLVEEVGPYIYREIITRVNVRFNENGTVTYQENVTHEWIGGRPDSEIVRVPNLLLIMAVQKVKDMNYVTQFAATAFLSILEVEPFKLLTVKEYLWGYTDNLLETAQNIPMDTEVVDKIGMLMKRSGLSKDRITVHTGNGDIDKLGLYEELNGLKSLKVWGGEECDKIQGTDGSMFPPNIIRDRDAPLEIYTRDICRKFSLTYHSTNASFGIPSLRYKPAKDVFTASSTKNSCFCEKTVQDSKGTIQSCPPAGVFNVSACQFGAPLLISFPHFYRGEKILLKNVDGLKPNAELHETYLDVHPRLGTPIGGWSRMQVNLQVTVVPTVPVLDLLKDGMILPMLWFEIGIDSIPEVVLSLLKQAYFTASTVETTFKWGSLVCTFLSMCALAFVTKKYNLSIQLRRSATLQRLT
ncbi:lysosome membrane protein 2 [Neodiprion lecontei]|uniref:Lysosome membrane protein 2 n=1 Tax=Neodiprion lecontei TaxID=441921 RepID=A0A6J0B9B8_NEOLC|nr:lysosome membrane protein 2 [Neodiprion lecontei]